MRRRARAGAIVSLAFLAGGGAADASASSGSASSSSASQNAASPSATSPSSETSTARLTTVRMAHPSLRAVGARSSTSAMASTPTSAAGANASEVNAAAHVVESIAPTAKVRTVSKRNGSFVVTAVESGRTHVYRLPADMVRATPQTIGDPEPPTAA